MRYQTIIYMTIAEIAFLHPFFPVCYQLPLVDDRKICTCAANVDSVSSIPPAHIREAYRRFRRDKHTAGSHQRSSPSGRVSKRWQKCDIRQSSIWQMLKSHFCTLFVPDWYQFSSARRRPRHIHMCCQYRRILLKVAKMQFHTCWNRIIAIFLVNLQNSLVGYTDICY